MTARPRVLLITGALGPGGTELSVVALARGLRERAAAETELALLAVGGERARALRAAGVPVEELGVAGRIWRPRNVRRLLRLARIVRAHRIDVVHTFLFDADFYGMLAARLGRPRAVVTTRRALKRGKPHHLRGYRWTNRFVDRVVANSEVVRRFTIERERIDPGKVVTIPNGVDAARAAGGDRERFRRRHGIARGARLVGSLGTVKPVKGSHRLLEALAPLMQLRPEIELLFAGEAEGPFADRLRAEAERAGIGARVHFPGPVEHVADLLAALDVFVLPSLSEGMSNALLEAMAAGCAIVATDVGGNRECLESAGEEPCGLIVPPDDPAPLREAIGTLLDDPARRAALGERARRRARAAFSLERMIERTAELYRDLLARGR